MVKVRDTYLKFNISVSAQTNYVIQALNVSVRNLVQKSSNNDVYSRPLFLIASFMTFMLVMPRKWKVLVIFTGTMVTIPFPITEAIFFIVTAQ